LGFRNPYYLRANDGCNGFIGLELAVKVYDPDNKRREVLIGMEEDAPIK
jgi:hypothetical protein